MTPEQVQLIKTGFAILIGLVLLYVLILEPVFKKTRAGKVDFDLPERNKSAQKDDLDEMEIAPETEDTTRSLSHKLDDVKKQPEISAEIVKSWLKK